MKFRISTILLTIALLAVGMAWYVERTRHRMDLHGTWYYPTKGRGLYGYTSMLEIKPDGTFTKTQGSRTLVEIFAGSYSEERSGAITFHVTKKTQKNRSSNSQFDPVVTILDENYRRRCAVDGSGYLIIEKVDSANFWRTDTRDSGIKWESHSRDTSHMSRIIRG